MYQHFLSRHFIFHYVTDEVQPAHRAHIIIVFLALDIANKAISCFFPGQMKHSTTTTKGILWHSRMAQAGSHGCCMHNSFKC